jgi:hypothetical protein
MGVENPLRGFSTHREKACVSLKSCGISGRLYFLKVLFPPPVCALVAETRSRRTGRRERLESTPELSAT